MEDFSSLPCLYRDSAINELWEGRQNVLLTQIHRDLQKVSDWYTPADFVRNILAGYDETAVAALYAEISELAAYSNLFQMNEKTIDLCRRWNTFCHKLFHPYQDLAMQEVESAS